MTDKRLKEIKDSIDLQLELSKQLNVDNELLMEEKELYEYVEELKKQLQIKDEGFKAVNEELKEYAEENEEYKIQQQEFIKYLKDEIERKRFNATCKFEYNDTVLPLKEILQKYRSIIGGNKDE